MKLLSDSQIKAMTPVEFAAYSKRAWIDYNNSVEDSDDEMPYEEFVLDNFSHIEFSN